MDAVALSELDGCWTFDDRYPDDWPDLLGRCGGGFFHSPGGLLTSPAPGELLFARYLRCDEVAAIALGVRRGCRFSIGKRHVYFPTVPAVAPDVDPDHVLSSLVRGMRRLGAAEVTVDSFDAAWEATPRPAVESTDRVEFLISLGADEGSRQSSVDRMHRRHIRRGDREGWSVHPLVGEEAWTVLQATYDFALERAQRLGRGFGTALPHRAIATAVAEPGSGWGITVFAAWADEPMAAALIGWANGGGYYLAGGSTPSGYRRGAASWLQWQIMRLLRERGFHRYSLGGTPSGAVAPDHPLHGLYRFKRGLGAQMIPCRGLSWALSPAHLTAHRWARWTAGTEVQK